MTWQALQLGGTAVAHTPDSALLSITDNLDLRLRLLPDRWMPTGAGNEQVFISKRQGGDEWIFRTFTDNGRLEFVWWDTGGVATVERADADTPFVDGTAGWIRVRRSGTSVNFYTSTDTTNDHTAVSWTALGTTQTTPAGSIRSTVATHITIGASGNGGNVPYYGLVYAAAVVDNVTTRADPNFANPAEWTVGERGGDTASDGVNTWTLGGFTKALIVGNNMDPLTDVRIGVQLGLGVNPFDTTPAWTDVTEDVRTFTCNRGRMYELDRMDTGTASLELENFDGKYNSNNTASPYYPNIRPKAPIRIRVHNGAQVFPLWQGFVDRWPVSFPGNIDSLVNIECSDLFNLLARAKAAEAGRVDAVESLNPIAWWRMSNDASVDSSLGGLHALSWSGDVFTDQAGVWSGDVAVNLVGTNGHASITNEPDIERVGKDRSYEFWVRPGASGMAMDIINAAGTRRMFSMQFVGAGWVVGCGHTGAGTFISTAATVSQWHHLVVTDTMGGGGSWTRRLYFNGSFADEAVCGDPIDNWIVRIGSSNGAAGTWFTGDLSEIVVYPTALTPAEIAGLYAAQFESYATELTSERIQFILETPDFGLGGVVTGFNLDVGVSEISGPNSPTDVSALEAVQVAADTERGLLFIAGDGTVRFQNRHYRIFEQDTAITTFTSAHWITPVIGHDDDLLANDVNVSVSDDSLPFQVEDATSIGLNGRATLEVTIYPADTNEGLDAAYYLLDRYKDTRQRIKSLDWNLTRLGQVFPTQFALVLAAELSDRYNIEIPLAGDDMDVDVFLEHISHTVDLGHSWSAIWELSMADNEGPFWLLGVAGFSELGVTTWLGY